MIVAKFIRGEVYMDGGPFRASQSPERRSAPSRQEVARRPLQAKKQQFEEEEVTPVPRTTSPRPTHIEKSPKRFIIPSIVGIVLLLLGLLGGWYVSTQFGGNSMPSVDTSKYQAVFLTNGQVYFGKLAQANAEYMTLSDVFYLQGQQQAQDVTAAASDDDDAQQNSTQLIKLGEEIHGPEDEMIVNKDQVLFVENLKSDSTVVRTIQEYKNSQ